MSLAHFTLACRDVQATAAFFEKTLRWKRIPIPANTPIEAAWLEISPGQQVHILGVKEFAVSPFEAEFGRHMAFLHPGEDFEPLKKRLQASGAALIAPIRPTPFERFFFKDPNGYMFEMIRQEQFTSE